MLKFSIFSLLLLFIKPASAQESYIALITNPQIGAEGNAKNLIEVVDDINSRENVSSVVVLGDITANGIFDEFIWAQEILDGFKVPYFVVGGENDYLLSEGRGSEIPLLWGDDKKVVYMNNFNLVCFNIIHPTFSNQRFIDIETLNWLKEVLNNSPTSRTMIFTFEPIYIAANQHKFLEVALNPKLFSFVSKEHDSADKKSLYEGFYLNRNKQDWGYLLISVRMDTVIIRKMLGEEIKKKLNPEAETTAFTTTLLQEIKNPITTADSKNILWSLKLDKSISASTNDENDKIFCAFKYAAITCIDQKGKEIWQYAATGRIYSSPVAKKDLLAVATNDGDLLTLNANTGSLVQVIGIGETITSDVAVVDIEESSFTSKAVIVGTARGNLFCYDLYTLEPIWINSDAGNRINSAIVSADNTVLFQDKEGTLYCVSARNGLLLWIWKPPVKNTNPLFKSVIIVNNNSLYLIDAAGNLQCIDALLGTSRWNLKNISATGLIKVNTKGEFILATGENKILTVSTKLGKVTDEILFNTETKDAIITDIIFIGEKIMAGFSNGSVYEAKPKQKPVLIFNSDSAPIVSLNNVTGYLLVADYDGNLTMLQVSK